MTAETYFIKPLENIKENGFIDIYSIDQNQSWLDRHFFILYEIKNVKQLLNLVDYFTNKKGYINNKEYRINNKFYICFSFEISSSNQDDYEYFLNNKHNKIDILTKYKIYSYWKNLGINATYLFNNKFKSSSIPHNDFIYNNFDKILQS